MARTVTREQLARYRAVPQAPEASITPRKSCPISSIEAGTLSGGYRAPPLHVIVASSLPRGEASRTY